MTSSHQSRTDLVKVCCYLSRMMLSDRPSPTRKPWLLDEVANVNGQLLIRIRAGDSEAMTLLVQQHSQYVYRVARRILREREAAEDVMQEVLLQVWRSPPDLRPGHSNIAAWLTTVTRNRCIDILRVRRIAVPSDEVQLCAIADGSARLDLDIMMTRVRGALANWPPQQTRLLEMAFWDGRTHVEIAALTGLPLGTVKTKIRRSLRHLKTSLQISTIAHQV